MTGNLRLSMNISRPQRRERGVIRTTWFKGCLMPCAVKAARRKPATITPRGR
jgi:hypothetical protein